MNAKLMNLPTNATNTRTASTPLDLTNAIARKDIAEKVVLSVLLLTVARKTPRVVKTWTVFTLDPANTCVSAKLVSSRFVISAKMLTNAHERMLATHSPNVRILLVPTHAAADPDQRVMARRFVKILTNAHLAWISATRQLPLAKIFHSITSVNANLDSSKSVTMNAKISTNVWINTAAVSNKCAQTHLAATLVRARRDTKLLENDAWMSTNVMWEKTTVLEKRLHVSILKVLTPVNASEITLVMVKSAPTTPRSAS